MTRWILRALIVIVLAFGIAASCQAQTTNSVIASVDNGLSYYTLGQHIPKVFTISYTFQTDTETVDHYSDSMLTNQSEDEWQACWIDWTDFPLCLVRIEAAFHVWRYVGGEWREYLCQVDQYATTFLVAGQIADADFLIDYSNLTEL